MSTPKATPADSVVAVQNTKLAACMVALGFCYRAEIVQPERGKLSTQFVFRGRSVRPGCETIPVNIAALHMQAKLEPRDPMHPLCIMMRAQDNYDRLLDMQRGRPHRLKSTAGAQMTVYAPGVEKLFPPEMLLQTTDLALAAALAGVGIPVVKIEGEPGRHTYWLPRHGYARKLADGQVILEDAQALMERAPTREDPRHLRLEDVAPFHPVCLSYDALCCRALLKAELQKTLPLLQMQQGAHTQALISMNASGRVMDRVTRHLKAPPMRW
jgi:hypothetical protein